jgi:cold shock CspA family protein
MSAPSYVGTVKSFNPYKGWGFIECADTHQLYGSDVFLLKTDMNGFAANKGDQVSFSVTQGSNNKGMKAVNVKVLTVGSDGLQSFFGEVKSYNPSKGFGFITSPASESIFGKDVFVMKSDFDSQFFSQGTQVQFKAKMGERGPLAIDVKVLDQSSGASANGGGKGWDNGKGSWDNGKGYSDSYSGGGKGFGPWAGGNATPGQYGSWESGKGSWDAGKGWDGKGKGSWDGGKGWDAGKGWGPSWENGKGGNWGGNSWEFGKGGSFGGGWEGGKGAPKDPNENEVFFGTLKQINEKGWGHIACEATHKIYNKDMFVMQTSLENVKVQPGQQVSFTVAAGNKGAHAVNISVIDSSNPDSMVFKGTVKTYNEQKGYGFIDAPSARRTFGTDIFFHRNDVVQGLNDLDRGNRDLQVGDHVQFAMDISTGRASAKSVSTIALR